jgi:3',5'-cyclic AMP phosphodiesterase CpdA
MRIAHVSDIHVGAHDDLALDGLADDLHAVGVDATIVTGDLTMRARRHEFVRARAVIDQFPKPTMVVIGNHDVPLTNPVRRMSSPYATYRTEVTDELDPFLDLGAVRIQGLGSMPRWRWKSGRVSDRQAGVIRAAFADSPPGTARVVALHHPPSSSSLESLAGAGSSTGRWWTPRSTSSWPGTHTCPWFRS